MGFCRYHNLHFHPDAVKHFQQFKHRPQPVPPKASYKLIPLQPHTAEYDNVVKEFMYTMPTVKITKIETVSCSNLKGHYEQFCQLLEQRSPQYAMTKRRLYHGTSEALFPNLFTEGFIPPSDFEPSLKCPTSGKIDAQKASSVCPRTCQHCCAPPKKHVWNQCHMYGLGMYFANRSDKSDGYVKDGNFQKSATKNRKMLICEVALGNVDVFSRLLQRPDEKHNDILPPPGKDSVFVKGHGPTVTKSLGVVNDEWIVFHPFQVLPLFVVTYDK